MRNFYILTLAFGVILAVAGFLCTKTERFTFLDAKGKKGDSSMRSFYSLTLDPRPTNLEVVCEYELGDFDSGIFARCEWFKGPFPGVVKLWVEPGKPTDSLGGALSWPMMSEDLINIIRKYARSDIQVIPLPLFYVDTKKPVTRYKLVNILRSLEAIDMKTSVTSEMDILGKRIINVIKPVFRNDAIPADVHIFRPKESRYMIVISEELAEAMTGKVVGIALVRTKSV